ncbi:MAG: hypothetical protein J6K19_00815 [Prevotella sp.]|nr:hypothetical protein [Prevotella sp.]
MDTNTVLALQDYYESLDRKSKGQFLEHLITRYGFKYTTIRAKLTGTRGELRKNEQMNVQEAIENERIWRV